MLLTHLDTLFIILCCSLNFYPHAFKVSELIPKTATALSNTTVIMFTFPAKPLKSSLCCSSEASITFLYVEKCPSCLSAIT